MSQRQTTDARHTIMIIDDEPGNLRALSDHLLQRGFVVFAAQDGEEGLERARLAEPDLILLDVKLPGLDGLETCRRLKASDATRDIPVIFTTAPTDTATRIAAFEAGGVDCVTAPMQIEEVMARVRTHLSLHTVQKRLEQARDELEDRVRQRTAELHRLNRELRAISECNQTLLRATDEQTLVNDICRIVCEQAGYRMAWVGYAEQDEAKSVRPLACAGFDEGFLRTAKASWSEDDERGRGPTGTAIRTGTTCYIGDATTDVRVIPWRDDALQRGYRSGVALPLKDDRGSTFGALAIYSGEPDAFTGEEIRLLEELAHDLAYGITALRAREERQRAEEEVSLLRFALDHVAGSASLIGEDARYHYSNREHSRILGYTREELLRMSALEIVPQEDWARLWSRVKAHGSLTLEREVRTKDGRMVPAEIIASYFEYGGKAYFLSLGRDVSERKKAEEVRLEARVAERMRIARELHDTLLQSFHALLLRLQTAVYRLPENAVDARKTLEEAIEQASHAIGEGRDAVQGLRLSTLENNELAASIRTIGEEFASVEGHDTPTPFRVLVEGTPRKLHPILRDEVYWLAAEALRNAFRHAGAHNVEVEIGYDEPSFRLRVRDDGQGIRPEILRGAGRQGHYGLHGMRERAELAGGRLTIRSEPSRGTEVDLIIPASTAYVSSTPASETVKRLDWRGRAEE